METLTVTDYRVGWANYSDFVSIWLRRMIFSRGNLVRFGIYTALMLFATLFPLSGILGFASSATINGVVLQLGLPWTVLFVVMAVLTSGLIAAILAFLVGPLIAYVWSLGVYLLGPLRRRVSTVTLSPEGLIRAGSTASTPWTEVISVRQTARTILIFARTNSALIVPKTAFASLDEAATFHKQAENWWLSAPR